MAGNNTHAAVPHSVSTFQSPSILRTLRNIAETDGLTHDPMLVAKLQAQRLRELTGQSASQFDMRTLYQIPKIRIYSIRRLPVAGTAMWTRNAWRIEVNAALNDAERHYAVLHELKHIIDNSNASPPNAWNPAETAQAQEMAADYFASCVLNPADTLPPAVVVEQRS